MKKLALITGAGTGIGRATAQLFSEKKWDTLLIGRRRNLLHQTAETLPTPYFLHQCDISKSKEIIKLLKFTNSLIKSEKFEQVCLINCAGNFIRTDSRISSSLLWQKTFSTNLFGTMELTHGILPFLKNLKNCSIVNVSSTLGYHGTADTLAYSASKAALNNWTRALAKDLGPRNIRVNAVCPGIVDTPIHSFHQLPESKKRVQLRALNRLHPLKRIGTPEIIAKAIFFLASDDSNWTTGALLDVDGGINLN